MRSHSRVSSRSRSLNGSCSSEDSRKSPLELDPSDDQFYRVSCLLFISVVVYVCCCLDRRTETPQETDS